jgi:hypothetical protein
VNDSFETSQGEVDPGDVVSDRGYIVFKNRDLVRQFSPDQPDIDYGLDALYISTDLVDSGSLPRFTKIEVRSGQVNLSWAGPAGSYQVERADKVTGPYLGVSPVLIVNSWSDPETKQMAFYRLKRL